MGSPFCGGLYRVTGGQGGGPLRQCGLETVLEPAVNMGNGSESSQATQHLLHDLNFLILTQPDQTHGIIFIGEADTGTQRGSAA